jgi:hypothetical protein
VINAMAAGAPDDVDTYRRHAGELIRYATALVGPDDAPDVVTDGVLAAFATPGWSNVVNRRAYLYRAVFTRSLSHRRSVSRRQRRETIADVPIAGQASALPTPADLGLEENYGDCGDCPRMFTVSADGQAIAWIDPADDGTGYEHVVHSLSSGAEARTALHPDVPANLLGDLDLGTDRHVLSFTNFGADQPIPRPMTIPADDSSAAPTVLTGTSATAGPVAGD